MREHKVCKSESPTLSKGHSGAADPNPAVYGKRAFGATAQHRAVKKHFFQSQETSLHNTDCSTLFAKSLESMSGEGGVAAGLEPRAKMHQAQTTECVTELLSTAGLKQPG